MNDQYLEQLVEDHRNRINKSHYYEVELDRLRAKRQALEDQVASLNEAINELSLKQSLLQ